MFARSFLFASLLLTALASSNPAGGFCDGTYELHVSELVPKVEIVGSWNPRVYVDGFVTCVEKEEICKYHKDAQDEGIELVVESLVWSRSKNSSCQRIHSAKFRFPDMLARGQFAVIIAIGMAGAAVLVVFFGCLAFYAPWDSLMGRILRKEKPQPKTRNEEGSETSIEMTGDRPFPTTAGPSSQ